MKCAKIWKNFSPESLRGDGITICIHLLDHLCYHHQRVGARFLRIGGFRQVPPVSSPFNDSGPGATGRHLLYALSLGGVVPYRWYDMEVGDSV